MGPPHAFGRLIVLLGSVLMTHASFAPLGLSSFAEQQCWVSNDFSLYCFGENVVGAGTLSVASPNLLMTGVVSASSGYVHTCAVNQVGELYCWGGFNDYGQLGFCGFGYVGLPPPSPVLLGVASVSCGQYHTCAIMLIGGVRCDPCLTSLSSLHEIIAVKLILYQSVM